MASKFTLFVAILILIFPRLNAQWVQTNGPIGRDVNCIAVDSKNSQEILAGTNGGVFRSTDNGINWIPVNTGLKDSTIYSLLITDSLIYAGTKLRGVFLLNTYGANWSQAGLTNRSVYSLLSKEGKIFAGTDNGIYMSSDNGMHWIPYNIGLLVYGFPDNVIPPIYSLATLGNYLYAGSLFGGVFLSPDSGSNWSKSNNGLGSLGTIGKIKKMITKGSQIFTGIAEYGLSNKGLFRSNDNGLNWEILTNQINVSSCEIVASNIFVGDYTNGVYLSTDYGSSWSEIGLKNGGGLTNPNVYALAINNSYVFIGTAGNNFSGEAGIWRRPLSELTEIGYTETSLPQDYSLHQNFPNPFNPTTYISFSLPAKSFTSLMIFDNLGREISSIVSETLPAGTYMRRWDANSFTSGVYYYRLQAGTFTKTKKLVLLK